MRQMGREHQQDNCIYQNIVDAVHLRRIYVSQTLFELVLILPKYWGLKPCLLRQNVFGKGFESRSQKQTYYLLLITYYLIQRPCIAFN